MMLLDTHALVWWVSNPQRLGPKAATELDRPLPPGSLAVSSISMWEIAMLSRKGRLQFNTSPTSWLARVESLPQLRFLSVDNAIALLSVQLPDSVPSDPADRIIVATAIHHRLPLVTADQRLQQSGLVECIW